MGVAQNRERVAQVLVFGSIQVPFWHACLSHSHQGNVGVLLNGIQKDATH